MGKLWTDPPFLMVNIEKTMEHHHRSSIFSREINYQRFLNGPFSSSQSVSHYQHRTIQRHQDSPQRHLAELGGGFCGDGSTA
jgi:hypothetical protein